MGQEEGQARAPRALKLVARALHRAGRRFFPRRWQSTTIPMASLHHRILSRGLPMLVSEILAIKGKVLYTIAPERSLAEAVAVMVEQDVGSLVVFAQGRMAGILTFREVLQATHQYGTEWAATPIAKAMLASPLSAAPN